MINVQTSFADCRNCSLYNSPSAICETNCEEDLRNVDVIFVAENPGKEEVNGNKNFSPGTPLIGPAGSIFRGCFNEIKGDLNYFITNVVLCATIDKNGKTGNPTDSEIQNCKQNLFKFIEYCDPKLIVSMGTTPMKVFTGKESGITKNSGKIFYYQQYPVLITTHPSFVKRNGGLESEAGKEFRNNFLSIKDRISDQNSLKHTEEKSFENNNMNFNQQEFDDENYSIGTNEKTVFYKIPEYFYNSNYRLIDVQKNFKDQKLVFIFRDKDNNKIFYTPKLGSKNYYWYQSYSTNHLISNYDNLELKVGDYNKRPRSSKGMYESDLPITYKHSVDYYLQTQNECQLTNKNILFFDIEVYTFDDKIFPEVSKTDYPINSISFCVDDGPVETYFFKIDGEIDDEFDKIKKDYPNLTEFDSERELLLAFISRIHKLKPDFFAGWNSNSFDWPYIYNRMRTLKLDPQQLSPFGSVFIDPESGNVDICGYVSLDQMWIYKNLTYTNEPSYSLEAIAQKELGKGKKEYSGSLNNIYKEDIKTFIDYSIEDVILLKEIEQNKSHIALQDELRKIASATHKACKTTIGLNDCLFYFYLKRDGFSPKSASNKNDETKIPGAFVREPVGGYYDWVIDFDYKSLYPSIMYSFNLGPDTYLAKIDENIAFDYIYKNKLPEKLEIVYNPIFFSKVELISKEEFENYIQKNNINIAISGCLFEGQDKNESFISKVISDLFSQRKTYKKQAGQERNDGNFELGKIYDNYQQSYKILLNSIYGIMAEKHFRFFNLDLASTITKSGQDLIRLAADQVDDYMTDGTTEINTNFFKRVEEKKNYLLYIDTDSLFLWMEPFLKSKNIEITSENLLSEASKIQNYLNDDLLRRYDKLHNIDSKNSMFELENEFVMKRYYTLSKKKKYASYILLQDGVAPKKSVDIKGLDIKRSDFSEFTKNMLQDIVNMILFDESINSDKIFDYVDKKRNDFYKLIEQDDMSIYKMVSFAKPLDQYISMPQHIKGMLIWNLIEHEYFRVGTRGYLIPLSGIDLTLASEQIQKNYSEKFLKKFKKSDLNCIVVPEESSSLPIYYYVDKKRLVDFAIEDRINFLLEPLAIKTDNLLTW